MRSAKEILNETDLAPTVDDVRVISKRVAKKVVAIEAIRKAREEGKQQIAFSARPFVLCGLPIRRPKKGSLVHVRKNGKFFLRVTGDPEFGLPFGQDRLIPLWVATLAVRQRSRVIRFDAAAELLETFGLAKDGRTYRRLVDGFRRVFAATIFFGTEEQLKKAAVWDWTRFHFFDRLQVWYTRDLDQVTLPDDDLRNMIVLSESFWNELQEHPIPVDLGFIRAFANAPGKLDFAVWLSWRCWKARGVEEIPLFGDGGLVNQLGVEGYANKRKFRQTLKRWIESIRALWPECPALLSEDGEYLILRHAKAIAPAMQ